MVHLHLASVLGVSILKLSLGTFGMEKRISLAVFSSATRVRTMLSFQALTFWESYHRIPHPGALSQEVNKVSCGSISCTISNKPQARICSGCRRNIGVVGNFSEWDAINTEYSLSPSVNSDLLENECSRTIIWKCADLRPILSPKEILIWTFYTEFRQAWKLHTAGSKPSLGNFSPI